MGPLDGLHAQVQFPLFFADGGVIAVGQGTGGLTAEAGKVVLVAAECLGGGPCEPTSPCTSSGSG